jgi:predicted acyl esterase
LDHFLKGTGSWQEPRVRYERRRSRSQFQILVANTWPLADTVLHHLHLDAASLTLTSQSSPASASASYVSTHGRLSFNHRFTANTEITGSMRLTLFMSVADTDDFDVFVVLRKRDRSGTLTPFYGYNGFARDGVAKGWLRASHRELDESRSRLDRPFLAHRSISTVRRHEPTQLHIEIWPSSTFFEPGSQLIVEISGHDADNYPALRHDQSVNVGPHTVHTGPDTPSVLTFPVRNPPHQPQQT